MFKRFGSPSSIWKPKNPHSVEYLKYLHGVLVKNETVTEGNRTLLVEALRSIAEILIWGDQNDSTVFDFFLERQMLSFFLSIMKQKCGSYVCVQLLQTLNILFENIRHETSLYFLLSNNHVNSIITHKFDFNNEEIMAYYISFLKILSFKLNKYTVHFFFNEASQEFPLYTETIRFFNHSEGMVRIAVRTTTLNIYRVEDDAMRKFVRAKSRDYLSSVVDLTATHVVDVDHFARSAENEGSNRDRLADLIGEHLDHIHYLNDMFLIKDEQLSEMLSGILFHRLLAPLYLSSLSCVRLCPSAVVLTPVSSLFFLSQFLLIVVDSQAVQMLLSSFFFDDTSEILYQWTREQDASLKLTRLNSAGAATARPRAFFNSYKAALNCERNDHSSFFSLLLLYSICQNKGVMDEILEAAQITPNGECKREEDSLLNELLAVLTASAKSETTVRTVTIELCCVVLRQLLLAREEYAEAHLLCEQKADEARSAIVEALAPSIYADDLFLEMFEDEYYQFERESFRIAFVCIDPALLLPPSNTPLSGVPLTKRLPSGTEERVRRMIQLYLHLRKFLLDLRSESEEHLPLSAAGGAIAELNDCINLDNSDLLSCTVISNKGERLQRFLVADQLQLILVEPDNKRLGWGIVRFAGLLQDTHLTGDAGDSRALHVVVNDVRTRSRLGNEPLLSAKFIFDDHIRCMAAKQRLTKGRQKARQLKLDAICDILGVEKKPSMYNVNASRNPFRIVKGCAPGSVRKQQLAGSPTISGSGNVIPDDPRPASKSPSRSSNFNNIQDV